MCHCLLTSLKEQDSSVHIHTHTAGEKDTDCSVCSPDIVHIWYGTLAPNSLHTPLPFTLYYFMLIEKYYIQHHLSLLPQHPTTDLNACVYLYRQVKTGGRVGWLTVCVSACVSVCAVMCVFVTGKVWMRASRSDLLIQPISHRGWAVTHTQTLTNVLCGEDGRRAEPWHVLTLTTCKLSHKVKKLRYIQKDWDFLKLLL